MFHVRSMKLNIGTALVIGGIAWWLYRQSGRVDVGTPAITSLRLEGGGVRLNLALPIINRSNIAVPIDGFLGILQYNGQQIGTTTLAKPITVGPRAVSQPEFSTFVSLASVLTSTPLLSLLNTLAQKHLGISLPGIPSDTPTDTGSLAKYLGGLRMRGTLYVSGIAIDIDEQLTA